MQNQNHHNQTSRLADSFDHLYLFLFQTHYMQKYCSILSVFLCIVLFSCMDPEAKDQVDSTSASNTDTATIDGHPAWIEQGNIYEVNVRQYTPEGTFNAFAKHLPRLKEMGVQTLWFMPIQPIG